MKINFVDLQRQYSQHKKELDSAINGVIAKSDYILGAELSLFEQEFADFCEAKYCVGVASGTDALFLSLKALGISAGDEVITVPNSFIATALSASILGAKPVFLDIDEATYNVDISKIEEKITQKTKAIIPVHLYGQPADMDNIRSIAQKYNLKILEDACQAHGARYKGTRVGNFGDIAAFSFHPSKNLGAYGDGGAVITNNKKLADSVTAYRTYGGIQRDRYEIQGFNSRLDTLQAAILRVKLKYLEKWNKNRRGNADLYNKFFSGSSIVTPVLLDDVESVFHVYAIRVKDRDGLKIYLEEKGVSTIIHYPTPIHLQKAYASLGYKKGDLPIAEKASQEILSLPIFPEITKEEIEYISKNVLDYYK